VIEAAPPTTERPRALLAVKSLSVAFAGDRGDALAVDGVSFDVQAGATTALVGESGCGKTATALAIVRLLPEAGRVLGGDVELEGKSLFDLDERAMQRVRGGRIGFVFQEPLTALNPVYSVGWQVAEAITLHEKVSRSERKRRAIESLRRARFPDPERAFDVYPHELSGGMRQRAVIASALAAKPSLLIADEPTTALDSTTQADVLDLLRSLRDELGMGLLLVAHDLALVSEIANEVVVLYAGVVAERGPTREVLRAPKHPYTQALLRSVPPEGVYRGRDERRARLPMLGGALPDLVTPPVGCRFAARCPEVFDRCTVEAPALYGGRHAARCFLREADPPRGSRSFAPPPVPQETE
jgi:oligopeptide/dipeptide ABC transporter ATP-binding protein